MTPQQQQHDGRQSYDGNCHCGAFCFRVDFPAPLIVSASEPSAGSIALSTCPCAYCTITASLLITDADRRDLGSAGISVTVTRGAGSDGLGGTPEGPLSEYTTHHGRHRFCGTCGTHIGIFKDPAPGSPIGSRPTLLALNARALAGIEVPSWSVPTEPLNDSRLGDLRFAAPATRPASLADAVLALSADLEDGEKIYSGGCHCGAVVHCVRTRPLDDPIVEVKECDCSSCTRFGCILTYPRPLSRVVTIESEGALASYFYPLGRKFNAYQFCRLCGICTAMWIKGPPEEFLASRPEAFRNMVREKINVKPVNVRTLDFFLAQGSQETDERERVLARLSFDLDHPLQSIQQLEPELFCVSWSQWLVRVTIERISATTPAGASSDHSDETVMSSARLLSGDTNLHVGLCVDRQQRFAAHMAMNKQ
ncbi:hypothetical protein HK405_003072 [Cladochytrium tenue]|nr:hypothetical protein HK405_003072 [Cladochytrium tenue]